MGVKFFLLISAVLFSLGIGLLSSYLLFTVEPPALAEEEIKALAKEYFSSSDASAEDGYVDQPMTGKVVIVTGATSGLGASFAFSMYKMGATVIVTSRSQEKSEQAVAGFRLDFPFSEGALLPRALDVSDFESVHQFSSWFVQSFKHLHILVNNAGINYATQDMKPTSNRPLRSKQGYDLLFASNYLGHVLLTDLLLPLLRATPGARVLQVSSNSHYMAPAASLDTSGGLLAPAAAQVLSVSGVGGDEGQERWRTAYGLSKLGQVMHAVELQRALDADPATDLKVFSFSPGLTYTGMVPERAHPLLKRLLRRLFFSPDAALYAPLTALFSRGLRGGDEYWSNTPVLDFLWQAETAGTAGTVGQWLLAAASDGSSGPAAKAVKAAVFVLVAAHQQLYYGQLSVSRVHAACADAVLTAGLYKWSLEEVHRYKFESLWAPPPAAEAVLETVLGDAEAVLEEAGVETIERGEAGDPTREEL